MNQILTIPRSIQKLGALLAVVSLLATSLPIGVMIAEAATQSVGVTLTITGSETVVFSNPGPSPVDLSVYSFGDDENNAHYSLSGVIIPTGGSITFCESDQTCDRPELSAAGTWNDGGDTLFVMEGANPIVSSPYTTETEVLSSFNVEVPDAPVLPQVVEENFNTHLGTDYTGLNVGFEIADFEEVTAVEVNLYDATNNLVAQNTHNQALLNHINIDGNKVLSTPFFIQNLTYGVETYWNIGINNLTEFNKPVKAEIKVTDNNNETYTAINESFSESTANYEDLFPEAIENERTGETFETIVSALTDTDTIAGDTIIVNGDHIEPSTVSINKNITIEGDGKPTLKVGSAINSSNGIFKVESGITFELSNVVLDGGDQSVYYGVLSYGNTTISNVDFRNIVASANYQGVAVASFGGVVTGGSGVGTHLPNTLTVQNSTFENIGRIGILIKGNGATAAIDGITYTGKGDVDELDYGVEVGAGGSATVTNSHFSNNYGTATDGSTSAGVLVTTYYGTGTELDISNSIIEENTSGIAVGYDANDSSVVTARNNNIVDNTTGVNSSVNNASGIDVRENWWGDKNGPTSSTIDSVSVYTPWLCGPFEDNPSLSNENNICLNQATAEITSPSDESVSDEITLEATYEDGDNNDNDSVNWAVYAGSTCTFTGANRVLGDAEGSDYSFDGELFTAGFDTNLVSDGQYCFVFNPVENNNEVPTRETKIFTVSNLDIVAPDEVEGLTVAFGDGEPMSCELGDDAIYTSSQNITIAWNESDSDDVTHYFFGTKFNSKHKNVGLNTSYSGTITPGNNPYHYSVIAADESGNESEISRTCEVILDQTAPSTPVITSPNDEQVFSSTPIINQWTASSDNIGLDEYQIAYRYDDGHTFGGTTCPDVTIDGNWVGCRDVSGTSRNHSPSSSEEGGVTIWVRAIDEAGNMSDWSEPVHYYYYENGELPVDEAPAVPTGLGWIDSNNNAVSDGGTTELVSGTASWTANTESDFSHYIYKYWNAIPGNAYNSTSTAYVVNNGTSNSRSGSFNQGEGTHYFCIVAVDQAGNQSACSEEFTVIYDNDPEEPEEPTATTTIQTVSGNTALAENQPGWLFNRDTSTQSPYAFVLGTSTVGTGSLFIEPIANNINGPSDKFIGELFLLAPISGISKISYDFNIASTSVSDADQFYVNLYTNFGTSSSTKYYDCRYDIVPTAGLMGDWTTVSINPAAGTITGGYIAHVQKNGSSPYNCPATPNEMNDLSDGSVIRAVALTAGDSAESDEGVSGYFDNVTVVQTVGSHTETTIYDFEPTTNTPTTPSNDNDNEDDEDGVTGGTFIGTTFSSGPEQRVLGVSTDDNTYAMLQAVKNRIGELLMNQYVAPTNYTPSGTANPSGEVLGESTTLAQADTSTPEEEDDLADVEIDTVVRDDEDGNQSNEEAAAWYNYLWWLLALVLLILGYILWKRRNDSSN